MGATRLRTIRRVVIPLMAGGMLAGFVTSFITAAVELSATMMLVTKESQAPMSYGIYLYMQSTSAAAPVLLWACLPSLQLPLAPLLLTGWSRAISG